ELLEFSPSTASSAHWPKSFITASFWWLLSLIETLAAFNAFNHRLVLASFKRIFRSFFAVLISPTAADDAFFCPFWISPDLTSAIHNSLVAVSNRATSYPFLKLRSSILKNGDAVVNRPSSSKITCTSNSPIIPFLRSSEASLFVLYLFTTSFTVSL